MKRTLTILIVVSMMMIQATAQTDAGQRMIGLQVDTANAETYAEAFDDFRAAGVSVVHYSFPWSEVEPDSLAYDFSNLEYAFDQVRSMGPDVKMELNLPPVNMGTVTLPVDLATDSLNDPELINRYLRFIDSVLVRLDGIELIALNFGNEHGGWLLDDIDKRVYPYIVLYRSAMAHSKTQYHSLAGDTLLCGATYMFSNLTEPGTRAGIRYILDLCYTDIINCNYYGIDGNFHALDTHTMSVHFDTLVSAFSDTYKQIYFTECGYPAGDTCNSSGQMQADFVRLVFRKWDQYHDKIRYVSFFKTTDWSYEVSDYITTAMGMGGSGYESEFREYLRTLGFREVDGTHRESVAALLEEACLRNFGGHKAELSASTTSYQLCPGDTLHIQASYTGYEGVSHSWTGPGGTLAGQDSLVLNYVPDSSMSLVLKSDNSCSTDSLSFDITLKTAPQASILTPDTTAETDMQLILEGQAGGTAPLSYQWYKESTALTGKTAENLSFDAFTASDTGAYRLHVSNDCGQDSSNIVLVSIQAVEDTSGADTTDTDTTFIHSPVADIILQVYPNPICDGRVRVSISPQVPNARLELRNQNGQLLQIFDLEGRQDTEYQLMGIARGTYFIILNANGRLIATRRIVVQ